MGILRTIIINNNNDKNTWKGSKYVKKMDRWEWMRFCGYGYFRIYIYIYSMYVLQVSLRLTKNSCPPSPHFQLEN